MEYKNEFPPNYEEIKKVFPVEDKNDVVFTYGQVCYNPYNIEIERHLEVHEEIHAKQQQNPEEGSKDIFVSYCLPLVKRTLW